MMHSAFFASMPSLSCPAAWPCSTGDTLVIPLSTLSTHTLHPPAPAPLQVVDGYDVVKAIESVGSRSGATSYEVIVADCGALPKGEAQGGGGGCEGVWMWHRNQNMAAIWLRHV
jgi:hypothetical protein